VRPGISIGICGEHAVDPAAVRMLARLGVSYVSCSPARLPVARLAVGREAGAVSDTTEA
jgi:pyruvate,orthophosphate dikinase